MSYAKLIYSLLSVLTIIICLYAFFMRNTKNNNTYLPILILCCGSTFFYDIRVIGFNLVQLLAVIYILKNSKTQEEKNRTSNISFYVFFLILYTFLVTLLGYLFKSDYILQGGVFQNQLRPYVQFFQFLVFILTFLKVLKISAKDSKKILLYFYKTIILISFFSIFQEVVFFIFHFDIFPILRDTSSGFGQTVLAKFGLMRVTGGLGEPKQLGKFIALGLGINLFLKDYLNIKKSTVDLGILLLSLFLTFSTTGYIIVFALIFLYILYKLKEKPYLFIFYFAILFFSSSYILNSSVVVDKFEYYSNESLIIGLEDTDIAITNWLSKNPIKIITGVGLGNVGSYAYEYAPSYALFIKDKPFTIRKGIILILSELGVGGLLLYYFIIRYVFKKSDFSGNRIIKYFMIFIVICYLFLTCEAIFLVLLMLLALSSNLTKKGIT